MVTEQEENDTANSESQTRRRGKSSSLSHTPVNYPARDAYSTVCYTVLRKREKLQFRHLEIYSMRGKGTQVQTPTACRTPRLPFVDRETCGFFEGERSMLCESPRARLSFPIHVLSPLPPPTTKNPKAAKRAWEDMEKAPFHYYSLSKRAPRSEGENEHPEVGF